MQRAIEDVDIARSHQPKIATPIFERQELKFSEKDHHVGEKSKSTDASSVDLGDADHYPDKPTDEELHSLHRVSGAIPWSAYTIAFVELCERFGYYGTTVVFTNFIQHELPPGSTTGAIKSEDDQAGALGMGQRASTGLVLFNSFWSYFMPLLGAYIADAHLGRFNTIMMAIGIALVGHIVLIVSAIPSVIAHPGGSIACFAIGIIIMGVGVGCFKSNIAPLIAEQYTETRLKVGTDKKGTRVVIDPTITVSRIFLYYYMMVNVGSLVGQISMVYAERYVGFWLSFLLPTIMFCFCPLVLWVCRNRYVRTPPTGSVIATFFHLWVFAFKQNRKHGKGVGGVKSGNFWDLAKPSNVENKPSWMIFDDAWVDQVRRGLKACTIFCWLPIYFLAYNQMTSNLTSQAATMELNGVPNDIITNLNPISLIIFIPLVDNFLYPGLRNMGINFSPIKRIFTGFMLAALSMICATVIQYYIYKEGPCGKYMNDCDEQAPINVWVQTLPYVFIGLSEIFTNITSLEYAFTKAPKNMRSLVMAINLVTNAFSSALSQAMVSLSEDPLLIWNYTTTAILAFVFGTAFYIVHRKLDQEEDALNMLGDSKYTGKQGKADSEA